MKIRSAALFLAVASCVWLIDLLYYTYQRFTGESAKYYNEHPFEMVVATSTLLMPIAFLVFSLAVYNKKSKGGPAAVTDEAPKENLLDVEMPHMTVGNWLSIFLVSVIPIVGIIFWVIWAVDDNNRIRKTWAAASLIWLVVQVILIVIIFYTVYNTYRY